MMWREFHFYFKIKRYTNNKLKGVFAMDLKKFVLNSFLLAIGVLLHQITPPLFLGMKPDFSLIMLFIIILINKDFKQCLAAGLVAGIFTALTTGFPGGQVANVADKLITTIFIFLAVRIFSKYMKKQILVILLLAIGTLISGTVFLSTAAFIAGLPGNFHELFAFIVLPASLINTIVGIVLYNVINISMERINFTHR